MFDSGSTDNFISLEMAQALKLQADHLGVPIVAESAFMGAQTHVTPAIGKLRMQLGDYQDYEEFLIAPTMRDMMFS